MIAILSSVFGGAVNKLAALGIMTALLLGAVILIYKSGEDSAESRDALKSALSAEKSISAREEVQEKNEGSLDTPAGRKSLDERLRKEYSRDGD